MINTTNADTIGDEHTHDMEQCTYVLEGKGKYYQEGQEYDIGPGTAIYSPPGISHRLDVTGEEAMTYVVVYARPGPEEELKAKGPDAFEK